MQLLLEGQTANSRIVLEGLQGLWQRQEALERRFSRRSLLDSRNTSQRVNGPVHREVSVKFIGCH